MTHRDGFWKLEHLSDSQLLESLGGVLRMQHRTLAELAAHLGEVEERRLHLEAACSSMFAYCVGRLGMSEDEACRRIDLARLARKFPALFAELESGQITLSVALVLKPILTPDNHRELLRAARGKSTQQARELVAERSPKPDVPSCIRKLPERQPVGDSDLAHSSSAVTLSNVPDLPAALPSPQTPLPQSISSSTALPVPMSACTRAEACLGLPTVEGLLRSPSTSRTASVPTSRCIEPLSAQRYRIQFTADGDLKRKLELARDLLRHANPSGDFAPIVTRALELLLDNLQRRRFGAGSSAKAKGPSLGSASVHPGVSPPPKASPPPSATPAAAAHCGVSPSPSAAPAPAAANRRRSCIPRPARRAVLERDGLECCWVDAQGVRCGSRAWLELDHRQPAGKGGSSEPDNVRLLCRAHNQLAAEHAYGREHIERASRRRRFRER